MRIPIIMIAVLTLLVSGCVTTYSNTTPTVSATTALAPVLLEPKWVPLTEGAEISFDENYKYHPSEMKLSNEMLLRGRDWNEYLKAYVELFPPAKRDLILEGITRHVTNYDKVEGSIRFEPVRSISSPYAKASYVAVVGSLRPEKTTVFAKFHYYGASWIFAQSFKVVADGVSFQSPLQKFNRDYYGGNVWETAYLDLSNKENRALIEKIVTSKEATIRFQGKQYYSDLIVTDRMRKDMSSMLKAIEATRAK